MCTLSLPAPQAVIMGFLELKRFQGWKETGTSGFLNAFPFDPAGAAGWGVGLAAAVGLVAGAVLAGWGGAAGGMGGALGSAFE